VKAVEETSKQVLVGRSDKNEYNIVPPFFHACCGGHTNFASDTWGEKYELIEGVDDPYCSNAPFFTWSKTFSKIDLKSIIGLEISSIRIISFNRSGRVFQIELQGPWGKKIINADSLRMMTINRSTTFNSKKSLPSTMFTVTQKGNDFVFNGRGYGHGVGLCQWGARRMAEQGWDYTEILRHYFPSLVLAILEPSESGLLNISQVEIMNKGEI
ncbi:MAG: SpoIID/LytB domain-containing protein, partial [Candidatus Omnitrophica bacterium]|nr:SpoIID/LytB domain-containing protein [Candidatus Omnitrophota bacterium]